MERHAYICNNCELNLNDHKADRMYAVNDEGKRIMCFHPGEMRRAYAILGDVTDEEFKTRTGVMYPYVCLDCAHEFQMDLERDLKECTNCHSKNFEMVPKMGGKQCPRCKTGIIEEFETGMII